MDKVTFTEIIMKELQDSLSSIREEDLASIAKIITPEKRIFCDGAGRSALQIRGFAMRLAQMGFQSAVIGEPTTSAIKPGDILLICSASGETPILVAHAQKARSIRAQVLLITAGRQSSLALICDQKILIHASTKQQSTSASIQPMGSLFEQSIGILFDALVLHLMKIYGISNQYMIQNHANLE